MKRRWIRVLSAFVLAALPAGMAATAQEAKPAQVETRTEKVAGTVVAFDMVRIPAGTVEVDGVQVEVKPFWIGKTEVTWDEYDVFAYALDLPTEQERIAVMGKTRPSKPYDAPDYGFGHKGYPALCTTRHAAVMYCKWLSEKTGKNYRLPTPAEWEWACRGGGDGKPAGPEEVEKMAWCRENSATDEHFDGKSHPVAQKQPNGYGLYDTLGNCVEWVINPGEDPLEAPIAYGGSWQSPARLLNCAYKQKQTARWNLKDPQDPKSIWWLSDGNFVSFRVVCEE